MAKDSVEEGRHPDAAADVGAHTYDRAGGCQDTAFPACTGENTAESPQAYSAKHPPKQEHLTAAASPRTQMAPALAISGAQLGDVGLPCPSPTPALLFARRGRHTNQSDAGGTSSWSKADGPPTGLPPCPGERPVSSAAAQRHVKAVRRGLGELFPCCI